LKEIREEEKERGKETEQIGSTGREVLGRPFNISRFGATEKLNLQRAEKGLQRVLVTSKGRRGKKLKKKRKKQNTGGNRRVGPRKGYGKI